MRLRPQSVRQAAGERTPPQRGATEAGSRVLKRKPQTTIRATSPNSLQTMIEVRKEPVSLLGSHFGRDFLHSIVQIEGLGKDPASE